MGIIGFFSSIDISLQTSTIDKFVPTWTNASILLSSHIISEVEKVAKSMAVLRDGAKVYDETYETFSNKAQEDGKDLEDAFFSFYDRKESNA